MSKIKWHSGPPPSVGWWPASMFRDADWMRWWNGRSWSYSAHRTWSAKMAADAARIGNVVDVEWTDRPASWPERSRT